MKTIFTFIFLVPFCLFGQQNSWFEFGSNWTYNYGTFANSDQLQAHFGITETTFAGKTCAKMETDNFPFLCSPVSPPYYFYESNDSIFFASEVDSTFRLAYDFNALPGDTWIHSIPIELNSSIQNFMVEVVAVNEVIIDGNTLKELVLSYTNPFMPPPIVDIYPEEISVLEFIGSTAGFFIPLGQVGACDNETSITIQCFNSTSLDYTNPEFGSCFLSTAGSLERFELKIFPNPAKEYISIDMDFTGNSTLKILQLDGKVIYSETMNSGTERIKLPSISAGLYVVEVSNDEIKYFGKIKIE